MEKFKFYCISPPSYKFKITENIVKDDGGITNDTLLEVPS